MTDPPWLTTAAVAQATGLHVSTISRWGRIGVLPTPRIHYGGRRGTQSRWPPHTVEQVRWVKAQLDRGFSFEEIKSMVARGEFKATTNGSP